MEKKGAWESKSKRSNKNRKSAGFIENTFAVNEHLKWTYFYLNNFTTDESRAVFLNLFWFMAPFLSKNFWRHPYFGKIQF